VCWQSINGTGGVDVNVTTLGIDLAKNTFSLHGVDAHGKPVLRRAKLMPFLAQQPPCLIVMEACTGSHHWARQLTTLGHRVGIMAPTFVIPYRKGGKNDGTMPSPSAKPSSVLIHGTRAVWRHSAINRIASAAGYAT